MAALGILASMLGFGESEQALMIALTLPWIVSALLAM